jgi:hypothetical protein
LIKNLLDEFCLLASVPWPSSKEPQALFINCNNNYILRDFRLSDIVSQIEPVVEGKGYFADMTLYKWLGIQRGIVTLIITLLAFIAFWAAEKAENK